MTKWLVAAAAAIVIVAIPVAIAAAPGAQKPNSTESADGNAPKACKAERASLGVEPFNKKYGTNHNLKNAFGKCVSGKSKGKKGDKDDKDEDQKNEDEKNENSGAGAKTCKAERASIGVDAFAEKYGTNHNLKNAFGKCVSGTSKGKD
jgi:hypothetical protein